MKFQKDYSISQWTNWSKAIDAAIHRFYSEYGFCPHILEANNHTHSQFDFLVNVDKRERQKVNYGKEKISDCEKIRLGSFTNTLCTVDFAVDELLLDKQFKLIYDSDSEWEEPIELNVPIDENVNPFTVRV